MFRHRLFAAVEIAADAGAVWRILAGFTHYPAWNPFLVRVDGEARSGGRIAARVRLPRGPGMFFAARVLVAEPGRELRWSGGLPLPGLFEGEHRFLIEPAGPGQVRLEQSEDYAGALVRAMRPWLDGDVLRGFEAMNHALKARAENPPLA